MPEPRDKAREKLFDMAAFCFNAACHPDPQLREYAWVLVKRGVGTKAFKRAKGMVGTANDSPYKDEP